jgi:hypothetical protein
MRQDIVEASLNSMTDRLLSGNNSYLEFLYTVDIMTRCFALASSFPNRSENSSSRVQACLQNAGDQ